MFSKHVLFKVPEVSFLPDNVLFTILGFVLNNNFNCTYSFPSFRLSLNLLLFLRCVLIVLLDLYQIAAVLNWSELDLVTSVFLSSNSKSRTKVHTSIGMESCASVMPSY